MTRRASSGQPEPVKLDAGAVWGQDDSVVEWGASAWEKSEDDEEGPPFVDASDESEDSAAAAAAAAPSPFADDGTSRVDFNSMTVAQLKDECKALGLKVGGVKADLVKRLEESTTFRGEPKAKTPRRAEGGAWSEGNMKETDRSGGRLERTP